MCKYTDALKKTKFMNEKDIINKYELSELQVNIIKCLNGDQKPKETILDWFDCNHYQKDILKALGGLKKKGLIYSVIGLNGWLGTEIKLEVYKW